MKKKYIGYHGTELKIVHNILEQGFLFSDNKKEWLGRGVYFFEEHVRHAVDWCEKARKYKSYAILLVDISASEYEQLDLTNRDDYDKFAEVKNYLVDRVKNDNENIFGIIRNKRINDGIIIDYLVKKEKIKLVRQAYVIPPFEERFNDGLTKYKQVNVVPTFLMLCVKHMDCIDNSSIIVEREVNRSE